MHPASRIFLYVLAALVIPGLSFFAVAVVLMSGLFGVLWVGRAPLALVWRTRWLLLVLALAYGYSLPGAALWPFMGTWSPSLPGVHEGLERVIRLVTLLLWLDLLVLRLPVEQLLSGLYALAHPLRLPGCDARRIALRLALTLKAIEALETSGASERAPGQPGHALARQEAMSNRLLRLFDPHLEQMLPEKITLIQQSLTPRDIWIPLLVVVWLVWEKL